MAFRTFAARRRFLLAAAMALLVSPAVVLAADATTVAGAALPPVHRPGVPPVPSDPGAPSPGLDPMTTFLRTKYARQDAIDWNNYVIVEDSTYALGDIPVRRMVARINAEGQLEDAYFDARDGRFISHQAPTYFQASRSKIGWDALQALAEGEQTDYIVTFEPPIGLLSWDDLVQGVVQPEVPEGARWSILQAQGYDSLEGSEKEEFAALTHAMLTDHNVRVLREYLAPRLMEVAQTPGVVSARAPTTPTAAEIYFTAEPSATRSIAHRPDVLTLDVDHNFVANATMDVARQVIGAVHLNNAGNWGSGRSIAVFDTGVSPVTSTTNYLPTARAQSFVGWETSTADLGNHGTSVAWAATGGRTSGGATAATHWAAAREASLHNAKVLDRNRASSESIFQSAFDTVAVTWNSDVGSLSVSPVGASDGTFWSATRLDYTIHRVNRIHAATAGNDPNAIESIGASYNGLTVSAYDDRGTTNLNDDTLPAFTHQGTTTDGRKKPDVSKPGVAIALPTNDNTGALYNQDGASISTPIAASEMALLQNPVITGRERKCAMVVANMWAGDNWYVGWGWGKGWTPWANGVTIRSPTISHGTANGEWVYVPDGSTIRAAAVWWREMSAPTTVSRFSNINLWIYRDEPGLPSVDSSVSPRDSVEGVLWQNNTGAAEWIYVQWHGYNVPGSGGQQTTVCWHVT